MKTKFSKEAGWADLEELRKGNRINRHWMEMRNTTKSYSLDLCACAHACECEHACQGMCVAVR